MTCKSREESQEPIATIQGKAVTATGTGLTCRKWKEETQGAVWSSPLHLGFPSHIHKKLILLQSSVSAAVSNQQQTVHYDSFHSTSALQLLLSAFLPSEQFCTPVCPQRSDAALLLSKCFQMTLNYLLKCIQKCSCLTAETPVPDLQNALLGC